MAFHCMNCNGSMVFDVGTQKMRCLHCDSVRDPSEFVVRDQGIDMGEEATASGMARFTCPSCGAELVGTDDSLVGFCPYCGGQDMVSTNTGAPEPERLIPFQVDKERCIEEWRSFAGKVPYLPAELKDPAYVERFCGIYMPFWRFDVRFGAARMKGSYHTVRGNLEIIEYADIDVGVNGIYQGISYDASSYLSDDLAERTQPFDLQKERPFSPAYLAGFYADASTVGEEHYHDAVENLAAEDMLIAATREVRSETPFELDNDPSMIDATITGAHQVLWPMWFLTWRKGDRVAYGVVNGESGKVVSDLPLDLRQFAIGCAVASAAIFVLLELLVQPTPMVTVLVGLFSALLMAFGLKRAAKQEWEHQMRLDEDAAKRRHGRARTRVSGTAIGIMVVLFAILMVLVTGDSFAFSETLVVGLLRALVPVITIGYVVYVGINVARWHLKSHNNPAIASYLTLLVASAGCALVAYWDPVNDGWFYLADAACIVALMVAAALLIRAYNLSTMRPAPRLFDREEVQ